MLPGACAPRDRRGHRLDLQLGGGLAQPRGAHAQLLLRRCDGAGLLPRPGAGARTARQTHHLPARRRQPVDESRLPRHHRRGRAEEPRAHRGAERHLRGQRRPSDPEHRGGFRRHGARGRLRPRARFFAACRISSSRPATSSSRRGRCSRRCTWSRRSRSPTTIRTCTIRRGARRSRRRCSSDRRLGKGAQSILHDARAEARLCPAYRVSSPPRWPPPAPPGDTRPRARSAGSAAGSGRPRSSAAACARRCAGNGCRADGAIPTPPSAGTGG